MTNNFSQEEVERILSAKVHLRQKFKGRNYSWLMFAPMDKMFVTGGAIASLLQGEDPNDYDVYFNDYNSMLTFSQTLQHHHRASIADVTEKYREFLGKDGKMITQNAITMDNKISFITCYCGEPKDVRKTFDYTHCLPYYEIGENKLYISRLQYDACVSKVLDVNNASSVKSYRERKFLERGYIKC
jgi:hypothetical protein